VLPREVFVRRARRQRAEPVGPSFELAWRALDPPGTVLDVGAGAGAASLPLAPRCTGLTAVDSDRELLDELLAQAAEAGLVASAVEGRWPDVAGRVEPADVVTCHHVLYNVPDLEPFVTALTAHARRLVVVELAARHPLTSLNELWLRFHGVERPAGPSADDAIAVLRALGVEPRFESWTRPAAAEYASFDDLVDVTRRRLCLPAARAPEVAEAIGGLRGSLPDLGSSGRELVTIWWAPRG
jgi:SAM-dependent methyltransferase